MTQPTRVLVPLDGSPPAEIALEEAFRLFPEADVFAIHVLQVTKPAGEETKSGCELAIEAGEGILDAAVETAIEYDRAVETNLVEGNAAKTTVRFAETNDIDHIVVGCGGRSGFARLVLGSVSKAVLRDAPCPVTVVSARRKAHADPSG